MKPYDFKELVAELKGHGLDIAEDAAEVLFESVLNWLSKSAVASENKFDDLILAVVPILKDQVSPMIDKIDGKEGE